MRRELRCPTCPGRRFWKFEKLRFPDGGAFLAVPTPLGGYGHFELLACTSCGTTAWYIEDVPSIDAIEIFVDARARDRRCGECDAIASLYLQTTWIRSHAGIATWSPLAVVAEHVQFAGLLFGIDICRSCARVAWTARNGDPLSRLVDVLPEVLRAEATCTRCPGRTRIVVRDVRDDNYFSKQYRGRPLALAYYPSGLFGMSEEPAGGLDASICEECNDTTWRATGLDAFRVDSKAGVGFVEGHGSDAGPYR